MSRVLVIGGAGYVGSHCCKQFAAAGWRVTTFDNLSRGWRDLVKWGPLIEGDILDALALEAAVRQVEPDVVAHFAGLSVVGESISDPDQYYRQNVQGTMNVLNALRAHAIDRLVFSSSAAVYGIPQTDIVNEDHPQLPISPYGATKAMAERMMQDYSKAYGLRSVALRYFNAAGADPQGETGERHIPETHLIPLAIRGAKLDDYVFTVFGGDFDTRDGTAVRDYVHVADLGRAHLAAAEYLMAGRATTAINLGTGRGTTVTEIADAIELVSGNSLRRRVGLRRVGDPPVLVASNLRAAELLRWRPVQSSIEEIVETAWRWHSV